MAEEQGEANPLDVLVDLFVYAPVGLLYEYPDVLPKLIKRGKSQVQLARVVGQLALGKRGGSVDVGDVAAVASTVVNRAITEFGVLVGLAPDQRTTDQAPSAPAEPASVQEPSQPEPAPSEPAPAPLPIANYDDLKAREIIPLLESLSTPQRATIRAHEEAGRSRKTILAKLDRLDG